VTARLTAELFSVLLSNSIHLARLAQHVCLGNSDPPTFQRKS
jgi:hypothetical protein